MPWCWRTLVPSEAVIFKKATKKAPGAHAAHQPCESVHIVDFHSDVVGSMSVNTGIEQALGITAVAPRHLNRSLLYFSSDVPRVSGSANIDHNDLAVRHDLDSLVSKFLGSAFQLQPCLLLANCTRFASRSPSRPLGLATVAPTCTHQRQFPVLSFHSRKLEKWAARSHLRAGRRCDLLAFQVFLCRSEVSLRREKIGSSRRIRVEPVLGRKEKWRWLEHLRCSTRRSLMSKIQLSATAVFTW